MIFIFLIEKRHENREAFYFVELRKNDFTKIIVIRIFMVII